MKIHPQFKKKEGRRLIIQALRTEGTLSELAEKTKLSKSTIVYHLKNLKDHGFVRFDEDRQRYQIEVKESLRNPILFALSKEKNFEELIKFLQDFSKNQKENKELEKLFKLLNFRDFLNDLLEFLYDQYLINRWTIPSKSSSKYQEVWSISWIGCIKINACIVCKNIFDAKESLVVSQTIRHVHEPYGDDIHTALIHNRCFKEYQSSPMGEAFDYCDYCGLPLSEKRLLDWIEEQDVSTVLRFILKYINQNERYVFNNFILDAIKNEFQHTYKIKLVEQNINYSIDDPLICKIFLNEEQVNSLTKDFPGMESHIEKEQYGDQKFFKMSYFYRVFEFLSYPTNSDFNRFFDLLVKFSNDHNLGLGIDSRVRGDELFSKFDNIQIEKRKIVSSFMNDPLEQLFTKIQHFSFYFSEVGPSLHRSPSDQEISEGFSLIKIKEGGKFHPLCAEKVNNSETSLDPGKK